MAPDRVDLKYAVLMGDIVGSEKARSAEQLHHEFNQIIEEANGSFREAIASPFTITLGDEFQGLVTSLSVAALIARELRLLLMSRQIDCRFVIGIVDLKSPLNTGRAWNMMGPGFAQARERLNEKSTQNLYRFALADWPAQNTLLEALGASLTSLEQKWTISQLHDISETLRGKSAAEIARQRNVSAHSVYKVRSTGELDLYLICWNAVLEALKMMDSEIRISQ